MLKQLLLLFTFCLQLFGSTSFSQSNITGCVESTLGSTIFLQTFSGSDSQIIDSVDADYKGCFTFSMPSERPMGIYRILLPQKRFLDVIFEGRDLKFHSNTSALLDSIHFDDSPQNQIYYQYLQYRVRSQFAVSNLRKQLYFNTEKDKHFDALRLDYLDRIKQEADFTRSLMKGREELFVSKLIRIDREPIPDPLWEKSKRDQFSFDHYLDWTDFSDTSLLQTNALSAKMIAYLSIVTGMYKDPDSIKQGFREASRRLLAATGNSKQMFDFVKNYLVNGFQRLGFVPLTSEIHSLNFPCCICTDSISPFEFEQLYQAEGKLFPHLQLASDKGKIRIPVKGGKFMVFFADDNCEYSKKMAQTLCETSTGPRLNDYKIVTIHTNPDSKNGYLISQKQIGTIEATFGLFVSPLVCLVDEEGGVYKVMTNWLELRRWLNL